MYRYPEEYHEREENPVKKKKAIVWTHHTRKKSAGVHS